jgi:hypothetical protein
MSLKPSIRWCAVLLLGALVVGCDKQLAQPTVNPGFLPNGTWGGDSAGMIVDDASTHFHIACTFGDVPDRIFVNSGGFFDVSGSYVLRAYPITVGPSLPARFVGQISGLAVTLVVIVNDTVAHQTVTRGPVRVTLGQDPRLGPCPICLPTARKNASMRVAARSAFSQPRTGLGAIEEVLDHSLHVAYSPTALADDAHLQIAAAELFARH